MSFRLLIAICLLCPFGITNAQTSPSDIGEWGTLNDLSWRPIHSIVLPTGKVLIYANFREAPFNEQYLWDPSDNTLSSVPAFGFNPFCSGHVLTADGRVFITGGTISNIVNRGTDRASFYDPVTHAFSPVPDMNAGRFYPSVVALANGDIVTMSGSMTPGSTNPIPEVFQMATGTWRDLSNASRILPLYPAAFLAPNGKVFVATDPSLYLDTAGAGQWSTVASRNGPDRDNYGSASMFDDGKVLYTGGGDPVSKSAVVIDLNAGSPGWNPIADMPQPRRQHNTTLLPDGRVLATGGSSASGFDGNDGAKPAIAWDPDTNSWSTWATEDVYRGYHSEAVLLPDGRVASIGGENSHSLQVFSPPYLFDDDNELAARPSITSAPLAVHYGDTFLVETPDAASVAASGGQVNWLRPSAVTHTKNMNQRINRLTFAAAGGGLDVTAPSDPNLAPPGDYMLFLINSDGVPSVAAWIRLLIDAPVTGLVERWRFDVDGRSGTLGNDATLQNGASVMTDAERGDVLSCDGVDDYAEVSNTLSASFSWAAWIRTSANNASPGATDASEGNTLISSFEAGGATGDFVVSILDNRLAFYDGDSGQSLLGETMLNDDQWHHVAVTADSDEVNLYVDGQPDGNSSTGVATALTANTSTYFCGSPSGSQNFDGQMDHIQQYDRAMERNEVLQLATIGSSIDPLTVEDIVSPPIEADTSVQYTAVTSGGGNLEYRWIFGDGQETTSSLPTTTHSYDSPGVYSVTLIVSDPANVDTAVENFFQAVHLPVMATRPTRSSSIIYEPRVGSNDRLWNVNPDNDTVSVFDTVTHTKLGEIAVGDSPRSLALAPGGRVWVTNKHSASISIINTSSLSVMATVPLPHRSQPHGLVFDPAGNAAYVALEALGEVHKLHPTTGSLQQKVATGPDVRHLSVTWDGGRVLLSRFVTPKLPGEETATPLTEANGELLGGEVLVVDAVDLSILNTVMLQHNEAMDGMGHEHGPNGHASARGIPNYLGAPALSPDGESAWVPSKQDNIKRGVLRDTAQLTHDTTYRAVVSRIALGAIPGQETEDYASRVDHDNSAVPSAAAFGYYGNYLFVALEGSRAVRVIDVYGGYEVSEISVGRAPEGVAVSPDGLTLYTHNFMDRSISVHDVTEIVNEHSPLASLLQTYTTVDIESLTPEVLLGKQLFYDALDPRLSFESYISCAGCHNDGDDDGRVWDFTGFGEGLRNTTDLRGRAGHGPLHWTGNFDEVQDFEGQIRSLGQGLGLLSEAQFNLPGVPDSLGTPKAGLSADLDALAAYVNSLTEADPSPHLNIDGSLTAEAVAGRTVFLDKNCSDCHAPGSYTDSALDVFHLIEPWRASSGTRLGQPLAGFDTPSLNGVWSSPPYLHDGSADTLADAIAAHDYANLAATDNDTLNLVAFLKQLDGQDAIPPTVPGDLSAVTIGTTRIDLDWNLSSDDSLIVTYNVYEVGITEPMRMALDDTELSLSWPDLAPGRDYTFEVRAVDGYGNVSAPSNPATAATLADADLDGMSDEYENAHEGLDPNVNDADGDLDGDGLTNLEEFLQDPSLDPTNADSDGDGIGDTLDDDPLIPAISACTNGNADIATVAQPIADVRTCVARLSVDVMAPTVISNTGHLTVIAPRVSLGSGISSGDVIVMNADPCPGCNNSVAPEVSGSAPADAATHVAIDSNLEISFSEPVNVAGDWFNILCVVSGSYNPTGSGGATPVAVTDGDPVFTLDPSLDFGNNEACTVTVFRLNVSDDDAIDPPDIMDADYQFSFTTVPLYDFGDAPDPTYPTLLANDGARHIFESNLKLGIIVDAEPDGWQSADGDGDDTQGDADEDGVTFTSVLTDDIPATLEVLASEDGLLNAWVDFDDNGAWNIDEQVFTNKSLSAGLNLLTFAVPGDAEIADVFARFRLSSEANLGPAGEAPDGEVEDYLVTIVDNVAPELADIGTDSVDEGETLSFTVTATDVDTAPEQTLTFSLDDGALAKGMTISPTGAFSWTPGEEMGDANHLVTITVTDDGENPPNLSDSQTISISVNEVNQSPVLAPIGTQVADEGVELAFTAIATDADLPAQTLTFGLDAVATLNGMYIHPTTGEFTWTPQEDQGLFSFNATITVTDNGENLSDLFDSETFSITVNEANTPPLLDSIGNQTVDEGTSLNFTANATDTDNPTQTLTYRLDATAESYGMSINAATGAFSWTPTAAQVGSAFNATITVTDNGINPSGLSVSETFSIAVLHVNTAPVLAGIGDKNVDELTTLSFTASASDTDDPANTLTFTLDSAAVGNGMTIDANTGAFSWTPTETQGGSDYTATITVTDDGTNPSSLTAAETITIGVNNVNTAPVLVDIGNKNVNEGVSLAFTATATDVDTDDPAQTLTFTLDAGALANGMTISPSGEFNWTPTETQGDASYDATITVTDNGGNPDDLSDFETISITVNEANTAPSLALIGDQSVDESTTLNFTASATDADDPAQTLTFTLDAAAIGYGMAIDADTGVFSWTPTETQGGTSYDATVTVTDDGANPPSLSAFETISVTVNEVNTPPVLAAVGNKTVDELTTLSFAASASDTDDPADTLTFTLDAAAIANGMQINAATGAFSWTPGEDKGSASHDVTITVTDSGSNLPNLADSETVSIMVNEVNSAPVLAAIGNRTVDEGTSLNFTANAIDTDDPGQTLTFSLDQAALDEGMTIVAGTGEFSWTPTEAQSGSVFSVTITVTDDGSNADELSDFETFSIAALEVNTAPVLAAIGNKNVDELSPLSFTASAVDTDDPEQALTFTLDAAAIGYGMAIDADTGIFSWTPTEAQGDLSYNATITVTDNGSNPDDLSDFETITITVNEVNTAPVLAGIGDKNVNEGESLDFTASATDSDDPTQTLTFTLDAAAESHGMSISPAGEFSWIPTETQGIFSYAATITVTDNGSNPTNLSASETIAITVNETNTAPLLDPIGDKAVDEGTDLTFTATATDADDPLQTLAFSLDAAAVSNGMTITPSGEFSWTPTELQGGSIYSATITVTDNGSDPPLLSASETISITVNEVNTAPVLQPIGNKNVDELTLLNFTASATDSDDPSQTLTFSLDQAALDDGMTISPSGEFSWTPTELQGGSIYSATITVTDNGINTDNLSASETVSITVIE